MQFRLAYLSNHTKFSFPWTQKKFFYSENGCESGVAKDSVMRCFVDGLIAFIRISLLCPAYRHDRIDLYRQVSM